MLYHYTKTAYVDSIRKHGIIPGHSESPYVPCLKDIDCVWLDTKQFPNSPGWSTIEVDETLLDSKLLEKQKSMYVEVEWYKYHGTIKPECIVKVGSIIKPSY